MKFWLNISRYPRFFISSIVGLFLVIISPILKVFKITNNRQAFYFLFVGTIIVGVSINLILNAMLNLEPY